MKIQTNYFYRRCAGSKEMHGVQQLAEPQKYLVIADYLSHKPKCESVYMVSSKI